MKAFVWFCVWVGGLSAVGALLLPFLMQRTCQVNYERSAARNLRTILAAQEDFRANDRDGDGVAAYWRADVSALYGMTPPGSSDMIKLIDISTASADAFPVSSAGRVTVLTPDQFGRPAAKTGYWFAAIPFEDERTAPRDPGRFAVCAAPEVYGPDRPVLAITQDGVVWSAPSRGRKDFPRSLPLDPGKSGWKRFEP